MNGTNGAGYRLDVTDGPQRGESARVGAGTTLGSGLGNDIVLIGSGIEETSLTFGTYEGQGTLALTVSGGTLRRDGVALEGKGPHAHVNGSTYRLGSTTFTLSAGVDGSASASDECPRDEVGCSEGAFVTALAEDSASSGGGRDGRFGEREDAKVYPDAHGGVWLPKMLFGIAALVVIAIGSSYLLHRSPEPERERALSEVPTAEKTRVDLMRRLTESGFADLSVVDGELGGASRVTGYVPDRRLLRKLKRMLDDLQPRPVLDVHVQSDVVEGVRDVYRTNGVRASVESLGRGAVRVVTAEPDPPDAIFMEAAAREDVAGLAKLVVRNEPPPIAPPEPPDEPLRKPPLEEPGKRVVAIVTGQPSYVVTEDDSRYFVGSSLPTGHTIEAIENEAVTLELSGLKTRLRF